MATKPNPQKYASFLVLLMAFIFFILAITKDSNSWAGGWDTFG